MIHRTVQHRTKQQLKELKNIKPLSSDRNDIINFLIQRDFIENYVQKLEQDKKLVDDVTQDIWIKVLEIEQERWDDLFQQGPTSIIAFISGIIYRQIKSSTSDIYNKYKKVNDKELTLTDKVWTIYSDTNTLPKDILQTNDIEEKRTS